VPAAVAVGGDIGARSAVRAALASAIVAVGCDSVRIRRATDGTLLASVAAGLVLALDQFDAAVERGSDGRTAHVGASAELRAVADEVVQIAAAPRAR
jgi:hypothetical protein